MEKLCPNCAMLCTCEGDASLSPLVDSVTIIATIIKHLLGAK